MDPLSRTKRSEKCERVYVRLRSVFLPRARFPGFTLVELVIVIAILAILGTIGFLSIQGYSASARDGARISNLAGLQKGLTLWKVVAWTFPMPENAMTLTASGVIIGYQGSALDRTASLAKLSPGSTRDPADPWMYTTYAVNEGQTKMQAMVFLEDGSKASGIGIGPGLDSAYAGGSSYPSRTPVSKGDALGIVLSSTGGNVNQPVQELYSASSFTGLDLAKTTSGSGYAMVFSGTDSTATVATSGTGAYTGSLFTFAYNKRADLIVRKELAGSDASLVGYWDMETVCAAGSCGSGNDGKLKDLSGYGNHGTCYDTNPTSCNSPGIWPQIVNWNWTTGKAMMFEWSSDFVLVPNSSSLKFWMGDFTIFAKINPKSFSWMHTGTVGRLIYEWDYPNGTSWWIEIYNSDRKYRLFLLELNWDSSDGNHGNSTTSSNSSSILNQNTSIWVVVNRIAYKTKFFNNWIFDSIQDIHPGFDAALNPTWTLFIWGNWNPWNGSIDEVRIYNRALSDSEISSLNSATK